MPLDSGVILDKMLKGGGYLISKASIVRPNNATPFTAGDALGTSTSCTMTFLYGARAQGYGGILSSALLIDDANQTTKGSFELWLFSQKPADIADNAPWAPTDAILLSLLGIVPFSTSYVANAGAAAAGNVAFQSLNLAMPFMTEQQTSYIYGIIVVRNTYTPVANEKFTAILNIV